MDTIAADIMSNEVLTIKDGISVEEALKLLINSRITGMPVVDEKGKMIGVMSEFDILAQIAAESSMKPEVFKKPAQYTHKVDSISEKAPLTEVIERFITSKYRRLPVTDKNGRLMGIITRRDLMRVFYYRSKLI